MTIRSDVRQDTIAVSTTSIKVTEQKINPEKRQLFYLRNSSPNATDIITINLSSNEPAVVNKGIVLKQGDIYSESTQAGFIVWEGQINAICTTVNGILTVVER